MKILYRSEKKFEEATGASIRGRPPVERVRRKHREGLQAPLTSALELCTDAVVLTDNRGYIRYVNSAFEKITGYTREEAAGSSLHLLDSGRQSAAFYREMREALRRDGAWRGRIISKRKDGVLYEEDCHISVVMGAGGDISNYVSVRRDGTDRSKLESIAEEADAENNIGRIFSGVRHEIGNVINSLGVTLEVLKAKLGLFDEQTLHTYVDRAVDQASKAKHLLHSLKNRCMFEQPELQNVDLAEFLGRFTDLVKDDFTAKRIEIACLIDADAARCYADPRILHQVLLNLVINASDALAGQDHAKVSITAFRSERGINVRVLDNGCGMSEEQLQNAFKPFHTTKAHGTGLGLVIARKLLAAVNGSIAITSSRGTGTAIDITLPRERTA